MFERLKVLNPYDGSLVSEIKKDSESGLREKIDLARLGFNKIREISQLRRAEILQNAADRIKSLVEEFASILVREVGKTIREARTEVARCINTLKLSSIEAMKLAGEEIPFSAAGLSDKRGFFRRVPCGVVVAITPFNFPLNLVAHKLGPAIASGCSVVLKPASVTPISGIKLADTLIDAGVPQEAMQVVVGPGSTMGKALVESSIPRMVTFTGSKAVGADIAHHAGLKKLAMELGSNSAAVILADGDLEKAAKKIRVGGFALAGQVCISTQRVYVEKKVFEKFLALLVSEVSRIRIGDPMDEETDLGPMIDTKEVDRVLSWIDEACATGTEIVLEGKREDNLLGPWILANVPESARLIRDEAFAPLVVVNPVTGLEDAIKKVNDTDYGLQASVFTSNLGRAFRACEAIDAGAVLVNEIPTFRADLMPYGGMKGSGLGREGPSFAVREMTEEKLYLFDLG